MGVAANQDIDAAYFGRKFHVLGKAEVREHDDQVGALMSANMPNPFRELLTAKAEAQTFAERGRHRLVDDMTSDADYGDAQAASLANSVRLKE